MTLFLFLIFCGYCVAEQDAQTVPIPNCDPAVARLIFSGLECQKRGDFQAALAEYGKIDSTRLNEEARLLTLIAYYQLNMYRNALAGIAEFKTLYPASNRIAIVKKIEIICQAEMKPAPAVATAAPVLKEPDRLKLVQPVKNQESLVPKLQDNNPAATSSKSDPAALLSSQKKPVSSVNLLNVQVRETLVRELICEGDYEQALKTMDDARDSGLKGRDDQMLKAMIFCQQGDLDQARKLLNPISKGNPEVLAILGYMAYRENRIDEAVNFYTQALDGESDDTYKNSFQRAVDYLKVKR
ncbi:MAG: hypothetical protein PHW04_15780 [Candidatus Wallbacteria bacterium]|nr:hypothetical protein [Candidatus Wallbacteria bacterium]